MIILSNLESALQKSEQVQNQIEMAKQDQYMNNEIRMYRG